MEEGITEEAQCILEITEAFNDMFVKLKADNDTKVCLSSVYCATLGHLNNVQTWLKVFEKSAGIESPPEMDPGIEILLGDIESSA
jgi:hypothetical protein